MIATSPTGSCHEHPLAALAAILLVAAGCASTSKSCWAARAPIDPALVQIYSTPPAGSQEIAQLESASAVGFGTQGQTDAAVARLKREAAALGANGVVLMGVGSSGSPVGMSVGAGTFGSHGWRRRHWYSDHGSAPPAWRSGPTRNRRRGCRRR